MSSLPTGSTTDDFGPVSARTVRPFIEALGDEEVGVCTAALRALVRLPLDPGSWSLVADWLAEALDRGPEAGDGVAFAELLDAAAFVPSDEVRRRLRRATRELDEEEAATAAAALARTGDPAALDALQPSGPVSEGRWPWPWLPAVTAPDLAETLRDRFRTCEDPMARWWLAATLAREGVEGPLRTVMSEVRARPDDFPFLLHAPPDVLGQELGRLGPLPQNTRAWLAELAGEEDLPEGLAWIAQQLGAPPSPPRERGRRPTPATPPPATDTRVAAEEADRLRRAGWPGMVGVQPDAEVLAGLSVRSASDLLADLVADVIVASEEAPWEATVGGNFVVTLAHDLAWHLEPDAPALLTAYARLRSGDVLVARQLGWLVAGAGIPRVVEELGRSMDSDSPDRRMAAAQLLEEVARTVRLPYPPLGGAGGGVDNDVPVTRWQPEPYEGAAPAAPAVEPDVPDEFTELFGAVPAVEPETPGEYTEHFRGAPTETSGSEPPPAVDRPAPTRGAPAPPERSGPPPAEWEEAAPPTRTAPQPEEPEGTPPTRGAPPSAPPPPSASPAPPPTRSAPPPAEEEPDEAPPRRRTAPPPAAPDVTPPTRSAPPAAVEEGTSPPARSGPPPAEPEPEPVLLGASAPASGTPGDEFTARFVAHTKDREAEVRRMLERLSPGSVSHLGVKEARWKPGTRVTVTLDARHLVIDEPEQHFEWSGDADMLEWDVEVPDDAPEGRVVLKYDVFAEGIRVAKLRIDFEITAEPGEARPAVAEASPATSAFASFSSKDELRVSDRVSAARISAGLEIFFSRDTMRAGEGWEQRLEKEIDERDLFLLFWSENAASSEWVEWEWRRALAHRGIDIIQLHPLVPKEVAPPPPELSSLHFEDPLMVIRRWDEQKRSGEGPE